MTVLRKVSVAYRQTPPFTIKEGDTLPRLEAQLIEGHGTNDPLPVDLHNAKVYMIVKNPSDGAEVLKRKCNILDRPEGTLAYDFLEADTLTAGRFHVEFEVRFDPRYWVETYAVAGYVADQKQDILSAPTAGADEFVIVPQLGSAP